MNETDVRAALRSLAERYARGVDRRDAEVFLSVFDPEAILEICSDPDGADVVSRMQGHEQLGTIPERIKAYERTFHLLGQSSYELGDGVATGEVYCVAHHLTPGRRDATNHVMYIRYDDVYRLGAGGQWVIAPRRLLVDWTETRIAHAVGR